MTLRRLKRVWVFLLPTCLLAFPAPGERAEPSKRLSLNDCIREAVERNPGLQRSRVEVERAEARLLEAGAVYDTRFVLDGSYEDSELPSQINPVEGGSQTLAVAAGARRRFSTGTEAGVELGLNRFEFTDPQAGPIEFDTTRAQLVLEQPLLKNRGGALDQARVTSAEFDVRRAELDFIYARDLLASGVVRAFWDAYEARALARINRASLERARELVELNREKEADGLLDETDVLAAEAALATREVEQLERDSSVENARDRLLQEVGLPTAAWDHTSFDFDGEPVGLVASAPPDAAAAFETARERRGDFAALVEARRAAASLLESRKLDLLPTLDLRGAYGRGGAGETFDDSLSFDQTVWSVGVTLETSWSRALEKSAVRAAQAELDAVEAAIEETEQGVLLECRLSARALRTAIARVAATEKARRLQERKLELEEEKMAQGRSETRFVLEYQDDLAFSELAEISARATYQKERVDYLRVQGLLLEGAGQRPWEAAR